MAAPRTLHIAGMEITVPSEAHAGFGAVKSEVGSHRAERDQPEPRYRGWIDHILHATPKLRSLREWLDDMMRRGLLAVRSYHDFGPTAPEPTALYAHHGTEAPHND